MGKNPTTGEVCDHALTGIDGHNHCKKCGATEAMIAAESAPTMTATPVAAKPGEKPKA